MTQYSFSGSTMELRSNRNSVWNDTEQHRGINSKSLQQINKELIGKDYKRELRVIGKTS